MVIDGSRFASKSPANALTPGSSNTRPAGSELTRTLATGDTLIVAKLDRAFRNAADALATAEQWKKRGIDLIIADMFKASVRCRN